MSSESCSHPGKRGWETEEQALRVVTAVNKIMEEETISDDAAREIADLLDTTPEIVQAMGEEDVIRALVGSDLS